MSENLLTYEQYQELVSKLESLWNWVVKTFEGIVRFIVKALKNIKLDKLNNYRKYIKRTSNRQKLYNSKKRLGRKL
jgi:hypothetical protein